MVGRTQGAAALEAEAAGRAEGSCMLCGASGTVGSLAASAVVCCVGCGLGRRLDGSDETLSVETPRPTSTVGRWAAGVLRDVASGSGLLRPIAERFVDVVDQGRGVRVLTLADDDAALQLRARGCVVTALSAADGDYDVAVVGEGLVHEADPLATLRAVARRLRPSGRLHLVVPNLAAATLRVEPAPALVGRWFFDAASLATLVEAAGLRIVRGPHVQGVHRHFLRFLDERRGLGTRAASRRLGRRLAAVVRTAGSGDLLRLEAERA